MAKVNKRNVLYILILQFILFNINIIKSDAENINLKNITTQDGLSQSTVETIIQDKKGYIWIGTNDGLNRYNGYDYKVYRHSDENKNSIANNYIVDLKEDNLGNIWVSTANGLSKINTETDKITNYFSTKERGNLSHNNMSNIIVTKENKIIVGTSNGIDLYDEKNDSFINILSKEGDLTNHNIKDIEIDGNEDIWIATNNGLNKIDISANKVYKFYNDENENSISGNYLSSLYYDKDGYMWVGTRENGLNRINIETNKVTRYKHNEEDKNSIPSNHIQDIFKDSNDTIWIATSKGLSKLVEEKQEFINYKSTIYDRNGLIDDDVNIIMQDKGGLIWLGTYLGISIFDPNNNIKHYKNNPSDENSLTENAIHGIYEDEDGLLWVGTNARGVNIIDRKNDKIHHLNKSITNNYFSNDSINDITGKGNEIYIATNYGLNKINKKEETLEVYKKEDGIVENNIRTLFLDSKNLLWIGTSDGISILDTKTNKIKDITNGLKEFGIEGVHPKAIYEDSEGIYWIGCFVNGGLIKIDPYNKTVKSYKNIDNNDKTISSDTVRSIIEDNNKELWIGTSYGLNKFNKKSEEFTRYLTSDGLANSIVYGIIPDENNNLWISTNNGLSKFIIEENKFENFGITDGLQGNEFNGRAAYKNNKGELFFGGINGLNIFYSNELDKKEYIPDIVFDQFMVNGVKYNNIDKMVFQHNENFINVNIFLPDYNNIKNIQYYYMLQGASEKWHELDSNNINYSNLSPGKYTLKIKARSHNGQETKENKISFKIKPPFYKSKIAFFTYLVISILVIYSYINRMKYLDRLVQKKTEQLNQEMEISNELLNKVIKLEQTKNNYFINLSHELRTPLNVIYTTEQLIREFNKSEKGIEKEKLTQYMDVMRRNTKRLLTLINNLIDTTKIEHGKYKINLQENNIVYVVEEAALSLKEYIESKGIELIIDPEIEEKIIMCDAYEIERCIVNLVGNAAKFTSSGGKIEVIIKEINNKTMIIVQDNGVGIDSQYHSSIFDRFNQVVDKDAESKGGSGLGLSITKHIIELHNGEIYVESEINKGCKFIIIL